MFTRGLSSLLALHAEVNPDHVMSIQTGVHTTLRNRTTRNWLRQFIEEYYGRFSEYLNEWEALFQATHRNEEALRRVENNLEPVHNVFRQYAEDNNYVFQT